MSHTASTFRLAGLAYLTNCLESNYMLPVHLQGGVDLDVTVSGRSLPVIVHSMVVFPFYKMPWTFLPVFLLSCFSFFAGPRSILLAAWANIAQLYVLIQNKWDITFRHCNKDETCFGLCSEKSCVVPWDILVDFWLFSWLVLRCVEW